MSGFKGTEGPWEIDGTEIYPVSGHRATDAICDMKPGFLDADAALIAAAPELLSAIQLMVSTYPYSPPCHGWEAEVEAHSAAKRAITKALGEQP